MVAHGVLVGLAWGFLTLLNVGAALLSDLLHLGDNWFKIHEYCNILNCLFIITAFALEGHVLEKYGRKQFYLKRTSMGLAIFILVVFQVLEEFNRPHIKDKNYCF